MARQRLVTSWCLVTIARWPLSRPRSKRRYRSGGSRSRSIIPAFRNLDLLVDPGRFAPWLRRIAVAVSIDWLRLSVAPYTAGGPTPTMWVCALTTLHHLISFCVPRSLNASQKSCPMSVDLP
jgi:hypothetical protein